MNNIQLTQPCTACFSPVCLNVAWTHSPNSCLPSTYQLHTIYSSSASSIQIVLSPLQVDSCAQATPCDISYCKLSLPCFCSLSLKCSPVVCFVSILTHNPLHGGYEISTICLHISFSNTMFLRIWHT